MTVGLRLVAFGGAEYHAACRLRDEVLRQPLGLRLDAVDVAGEDDQLHLLACDGETIVGCLLLVPGADGQIKMRQVAVAPERQGSGVGTALVLRAEGIAIERGFVTMTLHARLTAVPFYERLGYAREGELFTEVTVPHVRMVKRLGARPCAP